MKTFFLNNEKIIKTHHIIHLDQWLCFGANGSKYVLNAKQWESVKQFNEDK